MGPRGSLRLSFLLSRARFRTKGTSRKDTGRRSARTRRLGSRSRLAIGSIGWSRRPGPWLRRELARRTVESTRWKEILPVAWGLRTISVGSGNRKPAYLLFAFPDAQC